MANVTAKTSSNIFYKARCEAATHNEQLPENWTYPLIQPKLIEKYMEMKKLSN